MVLEALATGKGAEFRSWVCVVRAGIGVEFRVSSELVEESPSSLGTEVGSLVWASQVVGFLGLAVDSVSLA